MQLFKSLKQNTSFEYIKKPTNNSDKWTSDRQTMWERERNAFKR